MSPPEPPSPPRGVIVERGPDGLRITLPLTGRLDFAVTCCVMVAWFGGVVFLLSAGHHDVLAWLTGGMCALGGIVTLWSVLTPIPARPAWQRVRAGWFALAVSWGVLLALGFAHGTPLAVVPAAALWVFCMAGCAAGLLRDHRPPAVVFTAGAHGLRVRGDLTPTSRSEWRREEIIALGAGDGLWVARADGVDHLLEDRDAGEMDWLAGVLREALGVPAELPPRTDEVPVVYAGTHWPRPVLAFLRVRAREMTVRNVWAPAPHIRFRAGEGFSIGRWSHSRSAVVMPLAPTDVICRVGEDGRSRLLIAPTDSTLSLTIESESRDALQEALARFWGAEEDVESRPRPPRPRRQIHPRKLPR
jgi:hypothetical protein